MLFGQEDLPPAVDPGMRIAQSASIGDELVITSPDPQAETILAEPAGGVVYQTPVPDDEQPAETRPVSFRTRYPVVGWLLDFLRQLVTLLAFGALALWLIPAVVQRTVAQARAKPAPSAGYGLLAIFSGYFSALAAVAAILLAGFLFALLGLGGVSWPVFGIGFSGLALFVAVFSFLVGTASKLVVAFLVGYLLIERAAPQTANRSLWALIVGALIYVLVRSIPIVGFLIGLAATLVGVGAMWLAYQAWRNRAVPTQAA
jgi:hypothetical protein